MNQASHFRRPVERRRAGSVAPRCGSAHFPAIGPGIALGELTPGNTTWPAGKRAAARTAPGIHADDWWIFESDARGKIFIVGIGLHAQRSWNTASAHGCYES
jgi:hypothetical protein